jgi:hypothetical protein
MGNSTRAAREAAATAAPFAWVEKSVPQIIFIAFFLLLIV